MDLSNREQRSKMTLLGGLYITQFLGLGFIVTAVPAIMRDIGYSLDQIGLIYVLGLIWALKFLWAPFIDRIGSKKHGHYRSWLLVMQSLMIVSLIGAAFFDISSQISILAVFFALVSIFSATQDIAADALAVTLLSPEERGLGNSIQVAGGFVGNLIGGGVLLITYQWFGWQASLLFLAAATLLPLYNIWRHKEAPAPADARSEKVGYRDMARYFRRPGMGRWAAILLTYSMGIGIVYALLRPMLVDLGWSLDQIGFVTNILGALIGILGAAVAGLITQRIGRKMAMLIANGLVIVSILVLFPAAGGINNQVLIYGSASLMLFAYGANATILATMIMDKSDPTSAGTDYTLQYSVTSILTFILSGAALALAESIQYGGVLWLSIGLTVLSLVLIALYNNFEPIQVDEPNILTVADDASVVTG
ncbi:MAG: MFS transporter [Chloroflexota bacterium]